MAIKKTIEHIGAPASDRVQTRPDALDILRGAVYKQSMMQVQEAPTPASVVPIGEVTERYGVTEDQLRYWDELGILVPNRFGGHRAYSHEDLEKLGYILELKNRGYRPKEVRLLLEMQKLIERPSISGTSLLRKMLQEAQEG